MLLKIAGGSVHDPLHGRDGVVMDLFILDGKVIDPPPPPSRLRPSRSAGWTGG